LTIGSIAWFGLSFILMMFLGVNANGASATAVQLVPPGVVLVVTFWWLVGGTHNGA